MRFTVSCLAFLGLAACAQEGVQINGVEDLTWDNHVTYVNRVYASHYQTQPFDAGEVSVVANEHGDLHSYTLVRCRGGAFICGGSGGVGRLTETEDYYVVSGAYPHRTFYLSPGGDGFLYWRGEYRVLAWD